MVDAASDADGLHSQVAPSHHPKLHVVLIGATITGNRGAESMLRAAVQRIPEFEPNVRFTLLSLYPADDVEENQDPNLRIAPFSPAHMVFVGFPLAVIAGLLARLRLPYRFLLATRALRALNNADLVVDLSGISFVDGREMMLPYNALVILLPRLLGTPLIKYAQAMGPFRGRLNRWCAAWLLPKVDRIAARGRVTREFLDGLELPAGLVKNCADAGFAMRVDPPARAAIQPLLEQPAFQRPVVGVSASSVVDKLCRSRGTDYIGPAADFIRYLIDERGYGVCLVAHSARPGRASRKNNDLPVCEQIAARVDRSECLYPEQTLNAEALRALIGSCRLLVASRFHAMVSGLAAGVPTMLIGWSHKYAEVLEAFGLAGYALDYADLTDGNLRRLFERLEREEDQVRRQVRKHLPAVVESSLGNARLAAEFLAAHPARVGR